MKKPNLNQVMLATCPGWRFASNHDTYKGGRIIVVITWSRTINMIEESSVGDGSS